MLKNSSLRTSSNALWPLVHLPASGVLASDTVIISFSLEVHELSLRWVHLVCGQHSISVLPMTQKAFFSLRLAYCHEMCTWGGCLGTSYLRDMTVSSSGTCYHSSGRAWRVIFYVFSFLSYFLPLPWIFSLREIWLPLSFCLRHIVYERKSPSSEDLGFETATLFA